MSGGNARIMVPKGGMNEDNGSRTGFKVVQEDASRVILEVPADQAEEIAERLGGLLDMSE